MPDKLNEDYFEIKFDYGGDHFEGQVWPDPDATDDPPLQVTYYREHNPEDGKIIFLRQVSEGYWEQDRSKFCRQLTNDFIQVVGKQIELATYE